VTEDRGNDRTEGGQEVPAPWEWGDGLDREQLDRVIRRASELQHATSDHEARERIPESEVLRIGREVGLDPAHVRRALGELRAEALHPALEREGGGARRLLGPARVGASRIIPGRSGPLSEALERYLEVGESLRPVRKRGGRSRWEAAEGIVVSIQRGMRLGGHRYDLARARSLDVSVETVNGDSTLVAFVADLSSARTESGVGWAVGLGTGGAGLGLGVGVAVGMPVLLLPGIVVGLAGGVLASRRDLANRRERVRMVLEGILDRLESGERLLGEAPTWRERWLRM
jgi:hypothetical protein